jgi:LmbE family N-acetylglucosaminyl deacetylase
MPLTWRISHSRACSDEGEQPRTTFRRTRAVFVISLDLPSHALSVVCVGAHPDDIEIGCGGALLELNASRPLTGTWLVLCGMGHRADEAVNAAERFVPGADVRLHGLRDGHLPAAWEATKEALDALASEVHPDLVFAPRTDDSHQDHRLVGQLVTTAWRDTLVLHYEIPKWDGDLRPVTHYIPVSPELARRKVELLDKCFSSQVGRDWWDEETFLGLMRLRGIECRSRYAEGFVLNKAVLGLGREARRIRQPTM